ncbi:DUF6932 family protein [Paraburkholderia fungorum]|uniref:DUF6932 family protein n=1 Tax=Paraburkholderia fungorum TaxID=134537 RepID=UPI000D05482B|nr:hypothetical protein [Paraburkholderia fungorum]
MTFADFEKQFGWNTHRQNLLADFGPFVAQLRANFSSFKIVAYGSFISGKSAPGDIDLMVHVVSTPADPGFTPIIRIRTLAPATLDVFTLSLFKTLDSPPALPSADEMIADFNARESHIEKSIHCDTGIELT